MERERDHASISAGYIEKPGQCWTRSPKGSFSISFSLPHCNSCSPSPNRSTHTDTFMRHTQPSTHTQQYMARGGYLSLSNKDTATADISHPRQLGHNLGLNVCLMCLYM